MKTSHKSFAVWAFLAIACILLLSMPVRAEEIGPGAGLPAYSDNDGGVIYQGGARSAAGTVIGTSEGDGIISEHPEPGKAEASGEKGTSGEAHAAVTVHEGDLYIHDGVTYKKGELKGNFRLSGYENSAGNPTYSGKMTRANHTVAADLSELPLGTMIIVEGTSGKTVHQYDGVYQVEDIGSGVNGKHLDIYCEGYTAAAAVTDHGWQYSDVWIAVPVEE